MFTFNGISGSLEAEPDALPEAVASLSRPLSLTSLLGAAKTTHSHSILDLSSDLQSVMN